MTKAVFVECEEKDKLIKQLTPTLQQRVRVIFKIS